MASNYLRVICVQPGCTTFRDMISGQLLNLAYWTQCRGVLVTFDACLCDRILIPFSASVLSRPFLWFLCTKQICSISGHLLNLPTNYIHVIFVQQWLQNTQKFTFDSMHAWETAFFTSNKRLRRPFLWVQIHVSGHSLNLASKYSHVICVQQWLQNT